VALGTVVHPVLSMEVLLGREAGGGSSGGGRASSPILAPACAVGKSHLVVVADQGAPP
jgi:hypothetical protein